MFKKGKLISLILAVLMLFAMVGCNASESGTTEETETQQVTTEQGSEPEETAQTEETAPETGALISEDPITVTGWASFGNIPAELSSTITDMNDQLVWGVLAERTNVLIQWENVSIADANTQLGIVMASGDLPDLFAGIAGSANKYGNEGSLLALEDLIEEYAPNLTGIMEENPAIKGQITSPEGHIYFMPRLLLDESTQCFCNWYIRKDWLEIGGYTDVPEIITVDELYNVLLAVKSENPDAYPFIENIPAMIWNFGISARGYNNGTDFFVEDGELKYGPTDSRYQDALVYLNNMYEAGLIDPEYVDMTYDMKKSKVLAGTGGLGFGSLGGALTAYNTLLEANDQEAQFVSVIIESNDGETNSFGTHSYVDANLGCCISSTTEYAKEIVQLADYIYSDEGSLLYNFGVEGETFDIVDGNPVLNAETWGYASQIVAYNSFAYIYAAESYLPNLSEEALKGNELAQEYRGTKKIPILYFTDDESNEITEITRDLNTYVDEYINNFIMGKVSLDTYEEFQEGLKEIGCERLTELYNTAYQRYLSAIN